MVAQGNKNLTILLVKYYMKGYFKRDFLEKLVLKIATAYDREEIALNLINNHIAIDK